MVEAESDKIRVDMTKKAEKSARFRVGMLQR